MTRFPFLSTAQWLVVLRVVLGLYMAAGGVVLAGGRLVRPLAALFAVQHVMGIILVHGPRGWFTVGHQTGGAEYSVLLLLCFLLTASTARRDARA